MNKLVLKNSDGIEILQFKNFNFVYDDDLKRVIFQLHVNFDFFSANTLLEVEEFDFLNMKKCFVKLYKREWNFFVFNPIEERIHLQFELQSNDQIIIKGKLFNLMFTGKFEFEFTTNLLFIPEIIASIEMIFEQNNNNMQF